MVSAVCHGPAALVNATGADGKSIFNDKAFTGLSNAEESQLGAEQEVPFSLEDKIVSQGGKFEKAAELFGVSFPVPIEST